jgi:hypothetical protein
MGAFRVFLEAGLAAAMLGSAHAQVAGSRIVIPRSSLCVTEGAVEASPDHRLTVETPKMRAYVNTQTAPAILAHFTYVGPTAQESRLGSGEVRRQFGLKLRAQNACNLVYVMWRFEPESKVVVSVKRNAQQTTSSECGNRGYQNIKAVRSRPAPALRNGDSHNLAANMRGTAMAVSIDGKEVWAGDVGPLAADLNGPVGIRSDNVRLALDLEAGQFKGPHPHSLATCKSGPEVSD